MDCREEVVILERRLKPLPGLEGVAADLMGQRLHVKYDAARLTTSAMVDAVGGTGMRMWLEHEEPVAGGDAGQRRWLATLACGGLVTAAAALGLTRLSWLSPWFYVAGTVVGAIHPVRRGLIALRSRTLDINALMVIAAAGAVALGDWAEAASVAFLFSIAQWLEVRTMERARQAIRSLVDLAPREAWVRRDGREVRLPVADVAVGDVVIIRPGDKVPLDGVTLAGHSDVNEAPITGESLPIDKMPGDEVFAGTINGHGALEVRVQRLSRDTRLAKIIHLVEEAQATRAPVQTLVDRFAQVYTPVVVALAVAIAAVPWLAGVADPGMWAYRALVLLVIACPCALVISTPVSIVAALSSAARNGVLVKGGAHLERLAAVRIVAFDKTGTLTSGTLQVAQVVPVGSATERMVLRDAAAVDARSAHPIARAIVARAQEEGIALPPVTAFHSTPGLGVEGQVDGRRVSVGSGRFLESRGIAVPALDAESAGKSVVVVADGYSVIGAIAVADRLRDTAGETIELLRSHGIRRVVMLTGDSETAALEVARKVGIDECRAGLLPEQKHEIVRRLKESGDGVLMVGDGVNDAPALAAADVGAAMGAAGSDVALETADVALMSDELLKLPYALRLAHATLRNIRVNVAISLVSKLVFLGLAVAGHATLWMAILADTGATLVVVANALRLLRTR
jgi:Cd2+/Zn2+-exporting ATPase